MKMMHSSIIESQILIFFHKAYRMDFEVFHQLHKLLKHGIPEYIWNDQIWQSNGEKCCHYHNGEITTEIHLACAL